MRRLLVLIGASGAGKTAVAQRLARRAPWAGSVHHFDSIGVPRDFEPYGGPEAWQKWATETWLRKLAARAAPLQLLEAQTRPAFLEGVLADRPDIRLQVMLFDCSADIRLRRLQGRGQGELATARMEDWAAYLRNDARARGLPIIDTSGMTIEEAARNVDEAAGVATGGW
jgi:dephospho-CoA kinase